MLIVDVRSTAVGIARLGLLVKYLYSKSFIHQPKAILNHDADSYV